MKAQRVVIVGLGLMGGSLGLALRRRPGVRTIGVDSDPSVRRRARRRRVVHETTADLAQAVIGAQRVVFCTPVEVLPALARQARPGLTPGTLVMDVGSVKTPVVKALSKLFAGTGLSFVGAHPMAGSEKNGIDHARADLYKGAVCALTPTPATPPAAVRAAAAFWKSVGTTPAVMDAANHDRAVALVSHVPHLLAEALVLATRDWGRTAEQKKALRLLAARSFQDATRVAGANPSLWNGIFNANAGPVREAARVFQHSLQRLIERRWPLSLLRDAQRLRGHYRGN